jgi:hypothetical protein
MCFSAEPCARNRRASDAHSGQERRWARSPARSARGSHAVELERDRALGLAAGQRPFELLAERPARTEDERLHCGLRRPEHRCDLGIGAALELPHRERRTLVEAELGERAEDVLAAKARLVLELVGRELGIEHDLARPPRPGAEALAADVVRDRDQPVERLLGMRAVLEGAVGVEEDRLADVLRVGGIREHCARVAIDVGDVPAIETLERAVSAQLAAPQHAVV